MTFIVTVANRNSVLQIADTLLSRNGKPWDDKLTKTTIVHCLTGKLVVSYTGAAYVDSQRTDLWLSGKLQRASAWEMPYPEMIEFMRARLTEATPRNSDVLKAGLTVVVAGLCLTVTGTYDAAIAEVTNCQLPRKNYNAFDRIPPQAVFSKYFCEGDYDYYVSLNGAVAATPEIRSLVRSITKRFRGTRTDDDRKRTLRIAVELLHLQRRVGNLSNVIGANCNGVIINPDLTSAYTFYGPDGREPYHPNIVRKT